MSKQFCLMQKFLNATKQGFFFGIYIIYIPKYLFTNKNILQHSL